MARRILFIEDEEAFAVGVVDRLRAQSYEVELVRDGAQGFDRACSADADLIVLDVMLPGKSGFEICRELRRERVNTPILLLTARGEIEDRVAGLKLGADDYLVKPFAIEELLARIEALLRRMGSREQDPDVFRIGDLMVDFRHNRVKKSGKALTLSRAEYRLLTYLVEHRGKVIARETLLECVWNLKGDTLSRTVDVHVATLRRKIEPDPGYPRYLLTVKGQGYKLMA